MEKTIRVFYFILFLLLAISPSTTFAQRWIPGQDNRFPRQTEIDSVFQESFNQKMAFGVFSEKQALEFRTYLRPFAESKDPLGMFLSAQTHDWYQYGAGQKEDAAIALEFYKKAAKKKLAIANEFLYYGYLYGFMEMGKEEKKTRKYLKKTIKYGDLKMKQNGYQKLAGLYYQRSGVKKPKKAILYLERSMEEGAENTWQHDFLSWIYEEQNQMEKAIYHKLISQNINSQVQVAKWLVEGKLMAKDIPRAIQILFDAIEAMEKKYPGGLGFRGADNPRHYLNYLYYCDQVIAKKDLGKYLMDHFICP